MISTNKSAIDIEVFNLKELEQTLEQLSAEVGLSTFSKANQNSILRKAITTVSQFLAKAIKPGIPRETGNLKKSIGYKVRTYRQSSITFAAVGPRRGYRVVQPGSKNRIRNATAYAHLIDGGAGAHQITTRRGKPLNTPINHPGFLGSAYMQRGHDSVAGQLNEIMTSRLLEEIDKKADKLRIKNEKSISRGK